jgi:nicastrin
LLNTFSFFQGLVALLGAVDALSRVDGISNLKKQLVFLVLTGETWGYLGSRRFLHELDLHSDAVAGLSNTSIETVLEIGSVGKGLSGGINTFFAHKTRVSSVTNMTLDALKIAQDSLASKNIKILSADTANPGIPPSSLMAFMRKVQYIFQVNRWEDNSNVYSHYTLCIYFTFS